MFYYREIFLMLGGNWRLRHPGARYLVLHAIKTPPTMTLGVADHVWSLGELIDAALATQPIDPVVTAPDRRRRFRVIEGGHA
jgi:hypothetical protein